MHHKSTRSTAGGRSGSSTTSATSKAAASCAFAAIRKHATKNMDDYRDKAGFASNAKKKGKALMPSWDWSRPESTIHGPGPLGTPSRQEMRQQHGCGEEVLGMMAKVTSSPSIRSNVLSALCVFLVCSLFLSLIVSWSLVQVPSLLVIHSQCEAISRGHHNVRRCRTPQEFPFGLGKPGLQDSRDDHQLG